MFLTFLVLWLKLIISTGDVSCKGTGSLTRVESSCEMDATPRIVHFLVLFYYKGPRSLFKVCSFLKFCRHSDLN